MGEVIKLNARKVSEQLSNKKATPAELAKIGGITGEQLVALLATPEGQEELEKTLTQMFDIAVAQELKDMKVHNREEKRKAMKIIKKKYTKGK